MDTPGRPVVVRLALLVLGSTLALTASFVGLLALVSGRAAGIGGRLPVYVFVMAVAFVAAVVRLELAGFDGTRIIAAAGGVGALALLLVSLAGEGLVYAVRNPERVIVSELVFYFLAAGLIATGLGYWGLNHWREFAETTDL